MSTYTVTGALSDELGHSQRTVYEYDEDHDIASCDIVTRSKPMANYVRTLPARIPINVGHASRPIGELVYVERSNAKLWGVGVVDVDDDLEDLADMWSFSAETDCEYRYNSLVAENIRLTGVAITTRPAVAGIGKLAALPGDLRDSGDRCGWPTDRSGLVARAVDYWRGRQHHRATAHVINDWPKPELPKVANRYSTSRSPSPGSYSGGVMTTSGVRYTGGEILAVR